MAGLRRIPSTALIFAKSAAPDDEARFATFSVRAILFWHGRSVPNFWLFCYLPPLCLRRLRELPRFGRA
jgi:hypothetical protein